MPTIYDDKPTVVVGAVGTASVACLTAFSVDRLARRLFAKKGSGGGLTIYEDEDGIATEESQHDASSWFQKAIVALMVLSGFGVSLASAILETAGGNGNGFALAPWFHFAICALSVIQTIALLTEPQAVAMYSTALGIALSSTCLIAMICAEILFFNHPGGPLTLAQLSAASVCLLTAILIPRRPDVFRDGKVVEGEKSTSWLGRMTFAWADKVLDYATQHQTLTLEELPALHKEMQSQTLLDSFEQRRKSQPHARLWRLLLNGYWRVFAQMAVQTLIASIVSFAPSVALLGILRVLEEREFSPVDPMKLWALVFSLGASLLLSSMMQAQIFWMCFARLAIPIFEELAIACFAKSMRRRDAKSSKEDGKEKGAIQGETDEEDDDDDEDDGQKTRQAVINLIAIDARRISDASTFVYDVYASIFKLGAAFVVLWNVIGLIPLAFGFLTLALILPFNAYMTNRFMYTQHDLMKFRDKKVAVITEVLQGIRQVKFSALEKQWENKIREMREKELGSLWKTFFYDTFLIAIWILGPIMLSAVSLAAYAAIHGGLSASVAFTTLTVFQSIEAILAVIPEAIAVGIEAMVSTNRIEKHFNADEKTLNTIPSDSIIFKDATIAWPADGGDSIPAEDRFTLSALNLKFPRKGLSIISGKTGSGKSLLLASILGESEILSGSVHVPVPPALDQRFDESATKANWILDDAFAYVSQIPWIENATVRNNITFGLPFDKERYRKVLSACALEKDFEMLEDGDLTDIGANGINLSGGQKWRVSFARALYSRAGILIMDDIFSALDAHTGRHLYEQALTGELGQGRTRILVTHHVALCIPRTDYSVLLVDGTTGHAGTIEELRKSGEIEDILDEEDKHEQGQEQGNVPGEGLNDVVEDTTLDRVWSRRSGAPEQVQAEENRPAPKKFQQDEERATGSMKLSNYTYYLRHGGSWFFWIFILFTFATYMCLDIARSWWITLWTRQSGNDSSSEGMTKPAHHAVASLHVQSSYHYHAPAYNGTDVAATGKASSHSVWFYLGIYLLLSVLNSINGGYRYWLCFKGAIQASRNIFNRLCEVILRAPLRWLDTVPLGRILNRFTSDFNMLDSRLSYDGALFASNASQAIGIMASGFLVSPYVVVFCLLPVVFCAHYSRRYLAGAREVKRLESNAKSPIYEQYGSALSGLQSIRAFGKAQTYIKRMTAHVDTHASTYWHLWLFNRWLGIRIDAVGAVFTTLTAAAIVYVNGIDASLAGFALGYALRYTTNIAWLLRYYANVELAMNSVERIVEYSSIPTESQEGVDVPAAWPTEGELEVCDLHASYASDLPPVLKGLSFRVEKNQRVGVVGRTGAGKSSLTLALFRFIEYRQGTVFIDGIDISKIRLHDLRSRLAIIPQDPVLFSGTIRSNLDPFNQASDSELRDALQRVHLLSATENQSQEQAQASQPDDNGNGNGASSSGSSTIDLSNANVFNNLDSPISEGGLNLSQGQRQLLCLARAIVSRPKIMILDEATSAVDMSTDALIQESIRAEFGRDSTLLVIAHRLSTIADFDKILVMDAGKAVEYGSPRELMEIEEGVFKSLVEQSGEREELLKVIFDGQAQA